MKKVMVGTPLYDGRIDVWFVNAMRFTERLCAQHGIEITPIYMAFDSLVQRARNDLVRMALDEGYDELFFIDSDMEWKPEDALRLLSHKVDCVGAAYRKKTDEAEQYTVRAGTPPVPLDVNSGLWIVDGVGTGFTRITRPALQALWDSSQKYRNEGRIGSWIFDVAPVDLGGELPDLVSEDSMVCLKLRQLGYKVLLDPTFVPVHVGQKKYSGDFQLYVDHIIAARKAA